MVIRRDFHNKKQIEEGRVTDPEQTIDDRFNELNAKLNQILNMLQASHRGNEEFLWEHPVEVDEDPNP